MKSRLASKLTLALAAVCGMLLLLVLLLQFGFGRGYRWWPAGTNEATLQQESRAQAAFKLPPWNEYAGIHTRPLFNEDRKPTPPAPPESAQSDKPIPKLSVTLTGVIITPKVHVAMVVEQGKTQSTAVKEGGTLPGDLNAWSLVKVKPRGAVFKNSAGEEAELELIAKGSGLKPPQPVAPAPPVVPQPQPGTAASNPSAAAATATTDQANELQARI
ncbi:MAG: hypothetical protein E6K53_05330, partial [Gammaproteobacteria bacterium]